MTDQFLSERDATREFRLPSNLLRSLRKRQDPSGPPFFQFSSRSIRYSRDELHNWMSERHVKATIVR